MKSSRRIIVRLALVAALIAILQVNWKSLNKLRDNADHSTSTTSLTSTNPTTPANDTKQAARSLTISLKLAVGANEVFDYFNASDSPSQQESSQMQRSMEQIYSQTSHEISSALTAAQTQLSSLSPDTANLAVAKPELPLRIIAASLHLMYRKKVDQYSYQEIVEQTVGLLREWPHLTSDDLRTYRILAAIYSSIYTDPDLDNQNFVLLNDDFEFLGTHLGWFGRLAVGDSISLSPVVADYRAQVRREAVLNLSAIGGLLLLLFVSFFGFFIFLLLLALKRITFQFQAGGVSSDAALESFTLYLIAMFFMGYALDKLELPQGAMVLRLGLNCVFILSLGLLSLWPITMGFSKKEVLSSFGLFRPRRPFREVFLGLFGYLGTWPILIGAMIVTILLCAIFRINPEQGTHPIVPFLISTKSAWSIILTLLLASVVAPITEEILFRGIFYHYLRANMAAPFAMICCGFVFALVHPQGVIGLLPLTAIGCSLAFLREWRGSLLAPMIAHSCVNSITLLLTMTLLKT